jgi:hypothetical protein
MTGRAGAVPGTLRYDEPVGVRGRSWWWLAIVVVVTFFTLGPLVVPLAVLAWFVNVLRCASVRIRIDDEHLWVGRRQVALAALDPATLGRASNAWPWRILGRRHLAANPIWTRDSVAIKGRDSSGVYRVAVGTNRRDELVATLRSAIDEARERADRPPFPPAPRPGSESARPEPGEPS